MSKPTKKEMLNWFDEMWKSATIGDTWRLNKEATQMHLAIRSIIENMDKKMMVTKRELMDAISESEWQKTWNPIYNLFKAKNIEIEEEEKEDGDEPK